MSGVMRTFGRARTLILLIAVGLSLALFTGVNGQAAAAVRPLLSEWGKDRRPAAAKTRKLKGKAVKSRSIRLPGAPGTPIGKAKPKPTWPKPGRHTADLSAVKKTAAAARWVQAGKHPVWLTTASKRRNAKTTDPVPPQVQVKVADRTAAAKVRSDGLLLSLAAPKAGRVKVGVNYSGFRTAHGGDWASRLRLVALPACALTTPDKPECRKRTPLPTVNDHKTASLSADVNVPATGASGVRAAAAEAATMVVAVEAGASGPGGDWSATKLSPASNWTAGTNTGEFSWSYPMRLPPVPGDLLPQVSLGYSSAAVDGKTAADNSQASWVGDGFDYWPGFIERKYAACFDDGHKIGDLCWGRQNATLSLNGRSSELLWDAAAQTYRPKNDDGSTIERLTGATNGDNDGEWWRVTTLEGVQYIFGKDRPDDWSQGKTETNSTWTVPVFGDDSGEPCHKDALKDAWCNQAWRWNLDHVVDPHNNTITYFYGTETNNYTRVEQMSGGTPYISGGYLKRIDYGQRKGSTYATPAIARVRFSVATRTDYPSDQVCGDGDTCGFAKITPSFFDRHRLTTVTTELLTNKAAGTYSPVDVWDLGHTYQNDVLWLHTIDQTGKDGGSTPAPTVTLTGALMPNRTVTGRSGTGIDALPAYDRPRLVGVDNGTGSTVSVSYSDPYVTPTPAGDCVYVEGGMPDPKSNTKRCFPVKWQDPNGKVLNDWYHKYVATDIVESDVTGLSRPKVTHYDYIGGAAWRYTENDGLTKDKWRNWSQWRGYSKVRATAGDGQAGEKQSRSETTYARGMDGNYRGKGLTPSDVTITDSRDLLGGIADGDNLAGAEIETRTFDGAFTDAAEVSASVSNPKWIQTVSRTITDTISGDDITVRGGFVKPQWTKTRSRKADGTFSTTETYLDYDDLGRTVEVDDEGDPTTSADDTCSRTVYPSGTEPSGTVIKSLPIRNLRVSIDCDATASAEPNLAAADMISDVKTVYDSGKYGDYPTKGEDRWIETVAGVTGGKSTTVKSVTNTHDAYGRIVSTTQVGDPATTADDRTSTSIYTPAPEGWVTSSTVTTPAISVGGEPAEGFTTTTHYRPARGLPVKVTDHNMRTAEAVYDGLGRMIKAWMPDNPREDSPDRPSTTYTYAFPTDGNPVSITTRTLRKTDPATYNTSVELLDGLLRPRQDQAEAPGGGRVISDTTYDSRGLPFKTNAPYVLTGEPSGTLTSLDDNQVPAQTLTTYDAVGRPVTATLYSKSTPKWTTTTRYDGERTTVIPPSGAMPMASITDARGRVVETRQYKTSDLAGAYVASTYGYDGAGRKNEIRDAAGNVWKTTFDVQGRPVTASDPDKGTSTLTYDHFDQVKTSTDARGTTLTTTYDVLGRPTAVKSGTTTLTETAYDTVPYAKGLPASSTRIVNGNRYVSEVTGYDALYRPMGSTITIPPSEGGLAGTYTTSQYYNFDGTVDSTDYPAIGNLPDETVTTEYNADGMAEWSHGLATYVADTTYNSYGDVTQLALASVSDKFIWETFDYDQATRRLTRATIKRQTSAATYDVDTKYSYSDAGSITSIITDTVGKSTDRQCFTYDYAQRLTQAWTTNQTDCNTAPSASTIGGPAPYWTTYQFDAEGDKLGNRTTEIQHAFTGGPTDDTTRSYTYPAELGSGTGVQGPHALRSLTETRGTSTRTDLYAYDQTGNTTTRPGQKLLWDAEGHLSKVTDTAGNQLAAFTYDASGNRLIRKDPTGATLYLPGQELKVSTSGIKSAIRYYTHAGQTIAYRTGTSSSTIQFLMPDYQGSASVTINASNQNTWSQRRFGPFGNERTNPTGTWPLIMDKGYVGGTKDTSTGLTHLGAREYDPTTGRFASIDPEFNPADPASWNGYNYANNNSISSSDPDGRANCWGWECTDGGGTAVGGGGSTDGGNTGGNDNTDTGNTGNGGYSGGGAVQPPAPPAPPPCKSFWCKTKRFVGKHKATIVSGAVGVGCGVAVGWTGVGAVGCAAAAGAVYGSMSYAQNTPRDQWSLKGFVTAGAKGAITDAAITIGTAGLGKLAAPLVKRAAGRVMAKLAPRIKPLASRIRAKGGSSAGGGGSCPLPARSFVPGTGVLMADGTRKPIQNIKVGDRVLATNPDTGKTTPQTVLTTFGNTGAKNLVRITVNNDDYGTKAKAKAGNLIATDNHEFWLPKQRQWVNAGQLKPGMWLRTSAGTHTQITAIHTWTQHQTVHNLTVDTDHTYYVEASDTLVLVHNCGGGALRKIIGSARNKANDTYLGRRLMGRPMEPWRSNRLLHRQLGGESPAPNATVRDLLDLMPGNPSISYKAANAGGRSDAELMQSVFNPRDGQYIATYAGRPGVIGQGNHRAMELIARAEDPGNKEIEWTTEIFIHRVGE